MSSLSNGLPWGPLKAVDLLTDAAEASPEFAGVIFGALRHGETSDDPARIRATLPDGRVLVISVEWRDAP